MTRRGRVDGAFRITREPARHVRESRFDAHCSFTQKKKKKSTGGE